MNDIMQIFLGALAFIVLVALLVAVITFAPKLPELLERKKKSPTDLKGAVNEVLRLSEHLRIVEQLQYEEACKEDLMLIIHDLFCLQALENPEWFKDSLQKIYGNCIRAGDAKNKALARMYKKILDDLPQDSRLVK